MSLLVNDLVEHVSGKKLERVLAFSADGLALAVLDVDDPAALPVWRSTAEVRGLIEAGDCRVLEVDPYLADSRDDDGLSAAQKRIRDHAWEVIAGIVDDPEIFDRHGRGRLIRHLENTLGIKRRLIYKYLRRYWRGGQRPNALLAAYDKCGHLRVDANGNPVRRRYQRRPGPYSKLERHEARQARRAAPRKLGRPVSRTDRRNFEFAYVEYILGKKLKHRFAYRLMLRELYNKGYTLNQRGEKVPEMPPVAELPTYRQFRYGIQELIKPAEHAKALLGLREFNLKLRAALGAASRLALACLGHFLIDAWIADVWLVDRYDRSLPVGKPTVYIVQDVLSRMIVGLEVTLSHPSIAGAKRAFANTFTNKVEYCRRYGIEITEDEWPCQHEPDVVSADRGDILGPRGGIIVRKFGARLSNTAPYRADWKGLLEGLFKILKDKIFEQQLPGRSIPKKRGGKDYRLDATYDIRQFTQIMIHLVLAYNIKLQSSYKRDKDMLARKVHPRPVVLWRFLIQHRAGRMRRNSSASTIINLLSSGVAVASQDGILFRGFRYTCELAISEQWFERAAQHGRFQLKVSYDPDYLGVIWIWVKGRKDPIPTTMIADDARNWGDWTEAELEPRRDAEAAELALEVPSEITLQAGHELAIEKITQEALRQRPPRAGRSRTAKTADIRKNRQAAKEREQRDRGREQAARLGAAAPDDDLQTPPRTDDSQPAEKSRFRFPSYINAPSKAGS